MINSRNDKILKVAILLPLCIALATIPKNIQAQIGLGKMSMEVSTDDKTKRLFDDAANRRVIMSPEHSIVKKTSNTVTVNFHNPTQDTLIVYLYVSDTTIGVNRFVNSKDKSDSVKKAVSNSKLVKNDTTDSITSVYRPMGSWVMDLPKSITLAPGEKKNITFTVDVPETRFSGEYATWIVAEVQPRKETSATKETSAKSEENMATSSADTVYTISKVKLTYKTDDNNNESKSTQ